MRKQALAINTISHAVVDFSCFFFLFGAFISAFTDSKTILLGFMLYNLIAFGLQPFVGLLCDKKKNIPIAPFGVLLTMLAITLSAYPFVALILIAIGNACFHVGGGITTLKNCEGHMTDNGIFVASGAVGVSLGTLAGNNPDFINSYTLILLCLCGFALLWVYLYGNHGGSTISTFSHTITNRNLAMITILLIGFCLVLVRAFAVTLLPAYYEKTTFLLCFTGSVACIGKAAGGILGDYFGARKVGSFSLLLSIPCLLLGGSSIIIYGLGLLLFNMTMAITLCLIAGQLPNHPGFAFGITTAGLLLGSQLRSLLVFSQFFKTVFFLVLLALSVRAIYIITDNHQPKHIPQ